MPLVQIIVALVLVAFVAWLANVYLPASESTRKVVNVVVSLIVVGMILWAINAYIPMARSIKAILNVVVVIAMCVRVLQALGLWEWTVQLWHNLTRHHA